MTMPVTVDIADSNASIPDIENIFSFFEDVERRFSVFKEDSEISKINRGEIKKDDYSYDMK
jgi:thiamine biosynthesis lipoprotein